MGKIKGAKAIIESLKREGIDHIFSLPGTTILDLFDVLHDDKDMRLIVTRHEQGAAFMADGYARASGKPSVCMASRGPGALNMATGVYNAFMESSPVIALVGQVGQDISLRDAFEEIDAVAAFRPYTKWAIEIQRAERIPELVQRAVRTAKSGRPRPVMISVPVNLQKEYVEDLFWQQTNYPKPRADVEILKAAVDRIINSDHPVILAGNGINSSRAHGALLKFSEFLHLPVIVTWGRDDLFPNDHPLFLGAAGFGSAKVTSDYLMKSDMILAIGCRFSEFTTMRYSFPKSHAALITIDIESEGPSRVFPPAIGIISDAKLALEDLFIAAEARVSKEDLKKMSETLDKQIKEARKTLLRTLIVSDDHNQQGYVHPGILIQNIQKAVKEEPIIVTDCGSLVMWANRFYQFRQPGTLISPAGGSMGFGLPAAIGAQLAQPDRRVIAITGDGAFMMVLQELETAVRCKIPVIVVVMNNFSFANVKEKQIREYGGRLTGSEYSNPDFAQLAKLFGAYGERVEKAEDVMPIMTRALDSGLPSVLDVMIDPKFSIPPAS